MDRLAGAAAEGRGGGVADSAEGLRIWSYWWGDRGVLFEEDWCAEVLVCG